MTRLIKIYYDKLLLAAAAAVLALSAVWFWQQQPALNRLRLQPVAAQLRGSAYEVASLRPAEPAATVWPKALPQSRDSGWLYEVFTPPVIYYNALAKTFAVTPPVDQTDGNASFGLELLAVKAELFRLQLEGYFGGPGDYLAAFVSPQLAGTLLAREGRRFEELGLTLKSLSVQKVLVKNRDARPVYDVAALAVLGDERTGNDVVLDNRSRKFTEQPLAVLRLSAGDHPPREMHEGDSFSTADSTYRIERIQVDPPEVVVARQTPGLPLPETRVLRPVARAGAQVAARSDPTLRELPATTAVATNIR